MENQNQHFKNVLEEFEGETLEKVAAIVEKTKVAPFPMLGYYVHPKFQKDIQDEINSILGQNYVDVPPMVRALFVSKGLIEQ